MEAGGAAAALPLPEGVLLREDTTRGRHLVASRSFKRGELVLAQPPYRAVLDEQHTTSHCDHTFAPSPSGQQLLRCSRSKLAHYASRAAQKAAWRDGYKEECEALVRCAPRVPPPTVRLAARCLWRRQRERDNPTQAAGGWQSYEALCSLQHHWDELASARKQLYAQMAVLVRQFMRGTPSADVSTCADNGSTSHEKLWTPPHAADLISAREPDPAADEPDGLPSTKSIALLLARFAANAHTIADEELSPIGVGIFPLASMVNHSCTPTTTQIFSGSAIGFYAMGPIAPGQEITISYVELVASRQERRRALLAHYFFDIDVPCADHHESTAAPRASKTSKHNKNASLTTATIAMDSQTATPSMTTTTTTTTTVAVSAVGKLLCRTAPVVAWKTDKADAVLCALAWRCVDRAHSGSKLPEPAMELDARWQGGVEVLPGSGSVGAEAGLIDRTATTGPEKLSMLEQLLGAGLGGNKLWEQCIGDDPRDGATAETEAVAGQLEDGYEDEHDDKETELLAMGMGAIDGTGTFGLHQMTSGALRPKHSAAAIDQLPDDYGQRKANNGANTAPEQDASAGSELLPEVRIWGSDAAVTALKEAGQTVLQLLYEMADAGWKHSGGGASCGATNSGGDVAFSQKGADVSSLQRLLLRCDDLLGSGPDDKQHLALGSGHGLRIRLQSALMHAAIASEKWDVATTTAEELTAAYSALYPRYSPMLGLHWATVAKLLQFKGGRPQDALVAAERALEILGPTHRAAASAAKASGSRPSSVLAQLERVRSESALELAQMQQAGRQAHLVADHQ